MDSDLFSAFLRHSHLTTLLREFPPLNAPLLFKKGEEWGWRHCSGVESTCCSCRAPRFRSQNPQGCLQPSVLQSQEIRHTLLASMGTRSTWCIHKLDTWTCKIKLHLFKRGHIPKHLAIMFSSRANSVFLNKNRSCN